MRTFCGICSVQDDRLRLESRWAVPVAWLHGWDDRAAQGGERRHNTAVFREQDHGVFRVVRPVRVGPRHPPGALAGTGPLRLQSDHAQAAGTLRNDARTTIHIVTVPCFAHNRRIYEIVGKTERPPIKPGVTTHRHVLPIFLVERVTLCQCNGR